MKRRLIVIGPLPPPHHGVTVSTSLVLSNMALRERFDVEHLDTSDRRARGVATWDLTNAVLALRAVARLIPRLRKRRGIIYLPISQSLPGFLRDSLFIHAAAASSWKVATHLRGGELHRFHAQQPRLLQRWIELTLARVDALAVMGESLRSVATGLVPDDRVAAVPNGTPDPTRDGIVRQPRRVLFLSNLRRRKGVVEAVEAARIALSEEPSANFVFAGEWESDDLATELRRRVGNDDRIAFVSGVHDAARDALLASASILLFPPLEPEGHPRVILEGLAAGLPIVTTNRGAIAETVVDGESGFILDEAVPEELASRLITLLRDDELRERMGSAARTRYLHRFTQEAADRRLVDWLVAVDER